MGTSRRLLTLVLATVAAIAAVGLTATSAAALNGDTYNVIQSADRHQYCIDIDTTRPISFAPAQLWNCTHGPEQHFIRIAGVVASTVRIRIERGGGRYCLGAEGLFEGAWLVAAPCGDPSEARDLGWVEGSNGTLTNAYTGMCADAFPDQEGAHVELRTCNDSISQRWFL